MNHSELFTAWEDTGSDGGIVYVPVSDLIEGGNPTNQYSETEMNLFDDCFYVYVGWGQYRKFLAP